MPDQHSGMNDDAGHRSLLRTGVVMLLTWAALTIVPSIASAEGAGIWELRTTPAMVAAAQEAGTANALRDGGKIAPPRPKKIGLILLSAQSPANQRVVTAAQVITKLFHFKLIVCDPNFDQQRAGECATSLVAQRPDAMMSTSESTVALGPSLQDAHRLGIPWFSLVAGVAPSPALIPYGITGRDVGSVYDSWLFAEMAKRRGPGVPLTIMALGAPAVGLAINAQQQQLIEDAKKIPNVKIVVLHDLDLSNIVQDTLSIAKRSIQQYPDLGGTWTVCDLCVPLIAQVFASEEHPGAERPVVGGDYTMPQTVSLMRQGKVDGVVDIAFESSVYVAFDQLLEKWARGRTIDVDPDVFSKEYGLKFMEPYMVTRKNVGASGPIPIFGADYKDYFAAKWKIEFGVGG
jgi:ABC-type sugar transport system substrate-binding protein